jgi:hypothetical protein
MFGNEIKDSRGRVRVTLYKDHPYANTGSWQYRYRLIAMYALNRILLKNEHVDHIDRARGDDLSNLRVMSAEYHGRLHAYLTSVAECRELDAIFTELVDHNDIYTIRAARSGPVISTRKVE